MITANSSSPTRSPSRRRTPRKCLKMESRPPTRPPPAPPGFHWRDISLALVGCSFREAWVARALIHNVMPCENAGSRPTAIRNIAFSYGNGLISGMPGLRTLCTFRCTTPESGRPCCAPSILVLRGKPSAKSRGVPPVIFTYRPSPLRGRKDYRFTVLHSRLHVHAAKSLNLFAWGGGHCGPRAGRAFERCAAKDQRSPPPPKSRVLLLVFRRVLPARHAIREPCGLLLRRAGCPLAR